MKKWQLGLGLVTLSFGLGLALNPSSNTHAATWHNGVPRFLRGTWKNAYNGFHFY
ncbi:hypothetical protein [Lentilactobacillus kisonensis]|uniref:Uncharacterized protein n=2 Tax=Lentilactobacillus kisonensis TaxID=481722 RepID=H1LGV7_9LACO|nr:hypothetical protein [Lentilactobacillus kisonensis]EHO50737.1 hypothetical protein HMPREF9104_01836 [Lentilactobacillus kisonensis F0435]KRL21942.1 hypothetical protein FC98_GL000505 [Lentilactobacillus kisonensis DSM 19906 = JCM 15041]